MTDKNWRKMLSDIGGYENEMIGVPAGAVREMVNEIERLRAELAAAQATLKTMHAAMEKDDKEIERLHKEIDDMIGAGGERADG